MWRRRRRGIFRTTNWWWPRSRRRVEVEMLKMRRKKQKSSKKKKLQRKRTNTLSRVSSTLTLIARIVSVRVALACPVPSRPFLLHLLRAKDCEFAIQEPMSCTAHKPNHKHSDFSTGIRRICDAMVAPEDPTRTVWARHDRRKFNLNWLEWANVLQALFPAVSPQSNATPCHSTRQKRSYSCKKYGNWMVWLLIKANSHSLAKCWDLCGGGLLWDILLFGWGRSEQGLISGLKLYN